MQGGGYPRRIYSYVFWAYFDKLTFLGGAICGGALSAGMSVSVFGTTQFRCCIVKFIHYFFFCKYGAIRNIKFLRSGNILFCTEVGIIATQIFKNEYFFYPDM